MTLRSVPAVNMLRFDCQRGVHLKCGSDFRFPHSGKAEPAPSAVMWIFPRCGAAGEWDGSDCNSQGPLLAGQGMPESGTVDALADSEKESRTPLHSEPHPMNARNDIHLR
jgi:hypothetical protein